MPNIYWLECQNVHFGDTHDSWRVSHNSRLMRCIVCISYSFLCLSIPLLIKIEILLLAILSYFRNLKQHMCKQTPTSSPLSRYCHKCLRAIDNPTKQCESWLVSLCLRPFFLSLEMLMEVYSFVSTTLLHWHFLCSILNYAPSLVHSDVEYTFMRYMSHHFF